MKLVVLGNGFDLGHGLLTNFSDFIKTNPTIFEPKYKDLKYGMDSWAEIEINYKKLVNLYVDKLVPTFYVDDEVEDIIRNYGMTEWGEIDYYNYDTSVFQEAIDVISRLVKLLCEFESDFLKYLRLNYSDQMLLHKYKARKGIASIFNGTTDVLTFNYTNMVELLYGVKNVYHIHGNINNKIALGCDIIDRLNDIIVDGEYPSVDSFEKSKYGLQDMMAYYEFDMENNLVPNQFRLRFFNEVLSVALEHEYELRRILEQKSKDFLTSRIRKIEHLKKTHYDEVVIIGHSLAEVDAAVLDAINKDASVACYYLDEKDYQEKRARIRRYGWKCELKPCSDLYK
jgi:hypothetical protein